MAQKNKKGCKNSYATMLFSLVILLFLAYGVSAFTPKYNTQINLEPIEETSFLRLAKNVSEWNYEVLRVQVLESNLSSNNLSAVLVTEIALRDENKTRVIEHRMNLTIREGYLNLPYDFGEIAIFDGDIDVYKGRIILIRERTEISPFGYFLISIVYAYGSFSSLANEHSLAFLLGMVLILGFIIIRCRFKKKIICFTFLIITLILVGGKALAIDDSNPSNNAFTRYVNVSQTRNLTILFVPIESTNHHTFESNFDNIVKYHTQIINQTYPVADNGIIYKISDQPYLTGDPVYWNYNYIPYWLNFAIAKKIEGRKEERVMGIFPSGFPLAVGGFSPFQKTAIGAEQPYEISAHELGHTFNLCDEYGTFDWNLDNILLLGCPNANENGALNSSCLNSAVYENKNYSGCPVEEKDLVNDLFFNSGKTTFLNIMGDIGLPSALSNWVTKETYMQILNELETGEIPEFDNGTVTIISGFRNASSQTYTLTSEFILLTTFCLF